jgi:tetratricopeptide (TPR) repeat protein/DNA-binding SARP family transcriptional activator
LLLLGAPHLRMDGDEAKPWPRDKESQLLALLALERGRTIARYRIEQELWEETERAHPDPVISKLNTRLRESDLGDVIARTGSGWRFTATDAYVDCIEAEMLVENARGKLEAERRDLAWDDLESAIELLSEQFFAGAKISPFIRRMRAELEELLTVARILACETAAGSADAEWCKVAEREARAAIRERPADDEIHAALGRLLLDCDRHEDARDLAAAFERETGDPDSLRDLRAAALRGLARGSSKPPPLILSVPRADEEADFVGRDWHLEQLEAAAMFALQDEFAGRALVGEKGVGKSRIAREFGVCAHQKGFGVLTAGARRGLSAIDAPCKPLVDAVLAWVGKVDPITLETLDTSAMVELSRFSPELGEQLGLEQPYRGRGTDTRLRRGLVDALRGIALVHPTLLVVDDLGELDEGSILCLEEICAIEPPRLMVLATSGDDDFRGLPLRLLPVAKPEEWEAAALARAVLGLGTGQQEVDELVEMSASLPYLIVHRSEPNRIERDFVAPRVDSLGEGAVEVVRLAALLGIQIDAKVLRRAVGDEELVNRTLIHAERTKLVGPDHASGELVFTHSLTRDAILAGISSVERERLAEQLAEALGGERELGAARLRLLQQGGRGTGDEACTAALEAGDNASTLANYRAALEHYRKGIELSRDEDLDLCGRLLLGAGQAHWSLGEFAEAREAFLAAFELPGLDPALRAVAAIGFGGKLGFGGARTDGQYIAALTEVLHALGTEHPQLCVRVQAALAGALTFGAHDEEQVTQREQLVASALEGIEGEGPELCAEVLSDVCWTAWDPDDAAARRRLADDFVTVADESRDIGLAIEARIFRIASSLTDGDMRTVRTDMGRAAALGRRAGLAHFEALLLLLEAMESLRAGELDAARRFGVEALELGGREQNPGIFQLYGAQTLLVHLFEGRIDQIRAAAVALAGAFPHMPAWKAGLGLIFARLGRTEDARQQLDQIAKDDFAGIPRDLFWLITLDHAAKTAALLGDRERCERLYDLLEPHAGEVVVAGGAVAVYGAIDRVLGLTAAATGRREIGIGHLRDAVAINESIGAHAINTYVMVELARLLRAAGADRDARNFKDQATGLAERLGLALEMRREAAMFSSPVHSSRVLGPLKQRGAATISQLIKRMIDGKTDSAMNQLAATRLLRNLMPMAFLPDATCGWEGQIQLEFSPPIGYLSAESCWRLEIGVAKAKVHTDAVARPDLRLGMSPATFFKLMAGTLNPVEAWLDGDVNITGDPTVAARLVEMFGGPTPAIDLG